MAGNRLLIVDDDDGFRGALASAMTGRGFDATPVPSGSAALAWLASHECDVVLLDLKMPDMSGVEVLDAIRDRHPHVEVILLTGHGTIDTAIAAIRRGAFDFLTKPCSPDEVEITLMKAIERRALIERTRVLQQALTPPDLGDTFIGRSSQFQEILRLIDRVARVDSSVLILGETGVGKELVAKLIHSRGTRCHHPFVVVDCSNLHEELLQSELFGHEKGAYTGAVSLKHGLFEVADKGTVFLDEVGDVPPALQARLLRVLETGTFRRLGGTAEIAVNVRVLAATNRKLPEMVAQGHFREDLYYRLNTIRVDVPPLRERPDDIACLAAHFVARFNRRFGQDRRLSPEAIELLAGYSWPGNIRQLINVIEQVVVLAEEDTITPAHLPPMLRAPAARALHRSQPSPIVPLRDVERQYIEFAIRQFGGHRANAARALGIGERTLYRKLNEFELE
ncbi:MAG: sigma-54-dependent Fis family transcriptional regulator [Candidatus Rokubacteria bacterium]|nr:sigma-54-dependent Fis family transcriptional regulator [Candidatus Rokubacteria bacterium]